LAINAGREGQVPMILIVTGDEMQGQNPKIIGQSMSWCMNALAAMASQFFSNTLAYMYLE
jgi:hypothetical protein